MSETENQPEMSGDPLVEDLQDEVQSLRTLLSVSLVVLLVFVICVLLYLGIQISQLNKGWEQAKQGADAMQAQAKDMWHKMSDFSRTNPEFSPVLEKYRQFFTNQPAASAPAPVAPASKPMTPPAPKK